jgi:hypothetical protein
MVEVVDGPARGARGLVYGKHGAVLAALPQEALAFVAPGDRLVIEACGAGLAIENRPELTCLSLSPDLGMRWLGQLHRHVGGHAGPGRAAGSPA